MDGVLQAVVLGVVGVGFAAEQAMVGFGVVVPPVADAVVADDAGQGVSEVGAVGDDFPVAGGFLPGIGFFVADDAEGAFRVAADGGKTADLVVGEGRPDQGIALQGALDQQQLGSSSAGWPVWCFGVMAGPAAAVRQVMVSGIVPFFRGSRGLWRGWRDFL